jgi:hypothetical protein
MNGIPLLLGTIFRTHLRSLMVVDYLCPMCFSRLLLLLFLVPVAGHAQKWVTKASEDSAFVVVSDSRFDEVVAKQKADNLAHPSSPGYRVQIYFGVNRPKASEVKIDFSSKFPDVAAYLTYQQPNYKVRVGDFRNRYEAYAFLKKIEGQYPTTFVVPDEVNPPVSGN